MTAHIHTYEDDCPECEGIGRVSPSWDILGVGEAPCIVDCPLCDGKGTLTVVLAAKVAA